MSPNSKDLDGRKGLLHTSKTFTKRNYKRNVSHYRGQLFRLNFQRLISPASATTISTTTFFGNEISCAHIEVYLKKFFSHSVVSQVFNALGVSFLNINTNNIKETCPPKESANLELPFRKDFL